MVARQAVGPVCRGIPVVPLCYNREGTWFFGGRWWATEVNFFGLGSAVHAHVGDFSTVRVFWRVLAGTWGKLGDDGIKEFNDDIILVVYSIA